MNEIRRIDYMSGPLMEHDLAATPLAQFQQWLQEANAAGIEEPNAMTVATVDADEQPHVRTILCKEVTPDGFVFFTNYESDKGRQIDRNPADRAELPLAATSPSGPGHRSGREASRCPIR